MKNPESALIVALIISNFYLLGSSRLRALIRVAAFQGLALGLFPLLAHAEGISRPVVIIGIGGMLLKGIAIPLMLFRALRGVEAYREEKPRVGYTMSIAAGILLFALAFLIGTALPGSAFFPNPPVVSLAIGMVAAGLFIIIARTQTITQIIGYLVLENGIYIFGISLSASQSTLVEMGVLLDLLVGVFIMCIVMYHINREFESINTEELEVLKE